MSRRNVERDDAMLDLTGQYGIGLRIVYERLWFPNRNMGNAIQQLLKEGRLVTQTEGLPGNRSYYQLSPRENAARGFPSSHATPLGDSRLNERLATLWFATMGDQSRPLISAADFREQFGLDATKNTFYCMERVVEKKKKVEVIKHVVLRIKIVGPNMEPADVVRWLKEKLADESQEDGLKKWLKNRKYGYAVLVDDGSLEQNRVQAIKTAVKQSKIRKAVDVKVAFAPTAASLGFASQQYRAAINIA